MPPRSLTAPDGSIRTIKLEAEVSVDPGVLVGDYGLNRQGGRSAADARCLLDRGADRHEFDQTMADLGDVGLDVDDALPAQLVGFAQGVVDLAFREDRAEFRWLDRGRLQNRSRVRDLVGPLQSTQFMPRCTTNSIRSAISS